MNIACLSGKGGAGKTMLAVNLACTGSVDTYIDCDVEEPNGHLFLEPENLQIHNAVTRIPVFDPEKCTGCKKCVEFCRFHALMHIKDVPTLFTQVCHSCGGCMLVCPANAISESPRPIGTVQIGTRGALRVVTGILEPGEASGVPVIRQALQYARGTTVIDCPPGSACTVMECVQAADYCILVAEPTAFGFHNFQMVHQLVTLLQKPCGVVINKAEDPFPQLEQYCSRHQLPILARIPYDPLLAQKTAGGYIAGEESPQILALFHQLLNRIGGAP